MTKGDNYIMNFNVKKQPKVHGNKRLAQPGNIKEMTMSKKNLIQKKIKYMKSRINKLNTPLNDRNTKKLISNYKSAIKHLEYFIKKFENLRKKYNKTLVSIAMITAVEGIPKNEAERSFSKNRENREKLQKKMEKTYTKFKKYVNSLEGEVATAYKYS
jgi:hypothetical protein